MSSPVELAGGDGGEALSFARGVLHLALPRAFAPGAPIALTIELEGTKVALSGKTIGSKKREDGRFDVRARLVSLRREDRARLDRVFTPEPRG